MELSDIKLLDGRIIKILKKTEIFYCYQVTILAWKWNFMFQLILVSTIMPLSSKTSDIGLCPDPKHYTGE